MRTLYTSDNEKIPTVHRNASTVEYMLATTVETAKSINLYAIEKIIVPKNSESLR